MQPWPNIVSPKMAIFFGAVVFMAVYCALISQGASLDVPSEERAIRTREFCSDCLLLTYENFHLHRDLFKELTPEEAENVSENLLGYCIDCLELMTPQDLDFLAGGEHCHTLASVILLAPNTNLKSLSWPCFLKTRLYRNRDRAEEKICFLSTDFYRGHEGEFARIFDKYNLFGFMSQKQVRKMGAEVCSHFTATMLPKFGQNRSYFGKECSDACPK